MGQTGKQGLTTPPQQQTAACRKESGALNPAQLREDAFAASQAYVKQAVYEKRPYAKAAFVNPYNLSLFLGGLAAARLTLSPLLAMMVIGMEVLWMVYAPGSKLLQRLLWNPQFDQEKLAQEQRERYARLQTLDEEDRMRVTTLFDRQQEINRLAAQNPSFP